MAVQNTFSDVPATQAASVLLEPRRVELREVETPRPGPHEVLVAVSSVGVCGSDVHYYEHGRIGSFVVRAPLILGHEAAGTVIACGEGVSDRRRGQRVAIEPGIPCRRCRQCQAGRYNLCPDVSFLATPPVDGAFTQFLAVDADFAHPVPDELSDDAAALLEPLSVAIAACRKAQVALGDRVLITGAGPIGVLCALVAGLSGGRPTLTELDPDRRERARALGLAQVVEPEVLGDPDGAFEVLIECSGAPGVLGGSLEHVAPAGRVVAVGMSADDELRLPLSVLQTRELWLTGTFRYANTYPAAIALASSGAIELDALVDFHYGLGDVDQALRICTEQRGALKAVVHPQPRSASSQEV